MTAAVLATPTTEIARLDVHFAAVLTELRAHPPRRLSRAGRRARSRNLDQLADYRRRALFPRNCRWPGRQVPYFVDDAGTHCAMAHVIEQSGERDLVQHVARERNHARVRDLLDLPQLVAWLDANGLTAAEAARIQPAYCYTPADGCVCSNMAARNARLLEGTIGDNGDALTVTAVFGSLQGVSIGDVVPAQPGAAPGDTVLASWFGGTATALFVVRDDRVSFAQCFFSFAPGDLPTLVLVNALQAKAPETCEGVLTAHDPAWTAPPPAACAELPPVQPDATAQPADDDAGCAVVPSAHMSAPALILAAALALYGVRRARLGASRLRDR